MLVAVTGRLTGAMQQPDNMTANPNLHIQIITEDKNYVRVILPARRTAHTTDAYAAMDEHL